MNKCELESGQASNIVSLSLDTSQSPGETSQLCMMCVQPCPKHTGSQSLLVSTTLPCGFKVLSCWHTRRSSLDYLSYDFYCDHELQQRRGGLKLLLWSFFTIFLPHGTQSPFQNHRRQSTQCSAPAWFSVEENILWWHEIVSRWFSSPAEQCLTSVLISTNNDSTASEAYLIPLLDKH